METIVELLIEVRMIRSNLFTACTCNSRYRNPASRTIKTIAIVVDFTEISLLLVDVGEQTLVNDDGTWLSLLHREYPSMD